MEVVKLVDSRKLKLKIAHKGYNVSDFAEAVGIDSSTLYRKINNGDKFTIKELRVIIDLLNLSGTETLEIFFNNKFA